jgi:ComF family protein
MIIRKLFNLFFPLQNINFTDIDNYLSENDINNCKSRLKKITSYQNKYLESIFVISNYDNEIIFDLIRRLKYYSEWKISNAFAYAIYYKVFIDGSIFIPDPDVLIPIPADPLRLVERGYNAPTEICKSLGKKISVPYCNIIEKTVSTTAQNKLDRKERLSNLKNVFKINENIKFNLSNMEIIWIIDDVSTTGTTLTECAKIIKKNYPYLKIYGIVVSSN